MSEPLPTTATVGVVGAGTMGSGIAWVAAAAGHRVLLHDVRDGAVAAARDEIGSRLQRSVDKGRMTAEERSAILGRIEHAPALAGFADAALVIEAVAELLDVKRLLFAELDGIVGDQAILATNTSSLSVTAVAGGLRLPGRVVGMHFFNPAPVMPLVEIVMGAASDPVVVERVFATAAAWDKTPVRCTSTPGFIVNRVARPFYSEALRILSEGTADAATIDAIVTGAGGFRMGPFALMDLVGLDVNLAVTRSVYEQTLDPRFAPNVKQQALVDAGYLGRKSGRGWFDYGADNAPPAPFPPAPAPEGCVVGEAPQYDGLAARLEHAGVSVERGGYGIATDRAWLYRTDGRPASVLNQGLTGLPVILFDLVGDWATASCIAIAAPRSIDDDVIAHAAGLFQAAGIDAFRVADIPGLVLARIIAQLISVAADAATERVANPDDIDTAMRLGTNYPAGPFEWAERMTTEGVISVLGWLHDWYEEDRYRTAAGLKRSRHEELPLREVYG